MVITIFFNNENYEQKRCLAHTLLGNKSWKYNLNIMEWNVYLINTFPEQMLRLVSMWLSLLETFSMGLVLICIRETGPTKALLNEISLQLLLWCLI